MEDKKLSLYSYWRSSCSWRIRIVLNYKNIPYKTIPVHLVKEGGQQLSDKFTEINPVQRVPVLEIQTPEKVHLIESMAICQYLEDVYPEPNMLPKDPLDKATVLSICSDIACNIQPIQNLAVLNKVGSMGGDKAEWAKFWITKGLDALEAILAKTKGKYCFSDNVTLADAFLVPQLYNARRFEVDMSKYPIIVEIESNLAEIEAFKKAHANSQPDAEL